MSIGSKGLRDVATLLAPRQSPRRQEASGEEA